MQLAEREAVRHDRLSLGMAVRKDVRRLQKFVVSESADGAALMVGAEHTLAKATLVETLPNHCSDITPPRHQRRRIFDLPFDRLADLIVDRYDEGRRFGVIIDNEYRPRYLVEARDDAVKIDQRSLSLHCYP